MYVKSLETALDHWGMKPPVLPVLPKYEHWRKASAANIEMNGGNHMRELYKGKNLLVAVAFVAAMALGTATAHAQLIGELEANIPFAFSADNTRLPAGEYFIRPAQEIGSTVLEIESKNKNVSVFVIAEDLKSTQPPKTSELMFDKVGDHYFLREIMIQDSSLGYNLAQSKAEAKSMQGSAKLAKHKLPVKHHKTRASKA
jgi:hypothetical protein